MAFIKVPLIKFEAVHFEGKAKSSPVSSVAGFLQKRFGKMQSRDRRVESLQPLETFRRKRRRSSSQRRLNVVHFDVEEFGICTTKNRRIRKMRL